MTICEHGRQRSRCKECGGIQSASTVVSALSARSAVGTEICVTHRQRLASAKSAVGLKSVSMVVGALNARSAAGLKSASTIVSAINARSVARRRPNRVGSISIKRRSVRFASPHRRGPRHSYPAPAPRGASPGSPPERGELRRRRPRRDVHLPLGNLERSGAVPEPTFEPSSPSPSRGGGNIRDVTSRHARRGSPPDSAPFGTPMEDSLSPPTGHVTGRR